MGWPKKSIVPWNRHVSRYYMFEVANAIKDNKLLIWLTVEFFAKDMKKAIHPGSTLNSIVAVVVEESLKKLILAHSKLVHWQGVKGASG